MKKNNYAIIRLSKDFLKLFIAFIWGHSSVGRAPAWHAGGQR